ncbi:hypothetical protein FHT78_003650 [Rhizobium sp. BK196]|nr:hypothetical protein [Rhizobium sp. BK196]
MPGFFLPMRTQLLISALGIATQSAEVLGRTGALVVKAPAMYASCMTHIPTLSGLYYTLLS